MKHLLLLAVYLLNGVFSIASAAAPADTYPGKAIRFIVPFPAGGPADVLARVVGQKLTAAWGQAVVIDNHPGAGGNIGMELAKSAAPDGYTLVLAPTGNLTVNPSLYAKLNYDPVRDFAPVTQLAAVPNILVVSSSVPANSVRELIALAKAKPGELNFASPGDGSIAHLAGEMFKSMAGVNMVHIPFNGMAPAMNNVLSGQVQVFFAGITTAMPQVKAGKLKALAVASPQRVASLPQLPTVAESGLPGFSAVSWYGVMAPAGTSPAVIDKLNREIVKILRLPDVKEALAAQGAEIIGNTPEEFAAVIKSETASWAAVVRTSGAHVD
jgi:tripartite-type tricarboxylate transporter receptor subunit TctC